MVNYTRKSLSTFSLPAETMPRSQVQHGIAIDAPVNTLRTYEALAQHAGWFPAAAYQLPVRSVAGRPAWGDTDERRKELHDWRGKDCECWRFSRYSPKLFLQRGRTFRQS